MIIYRGLLMSGLVALLFLALHGCGSSDDPTGPGDDPVPEDDTTVPGPVTDLRHIGTDGTRVTLAWTAPGDDGASGTASEYDLRFATSVMVSANGINSSNWVSCFKCPDEPVPEVAGTEQVVTIDVGSVGDWYFALRTADEVPNWSTLSNNVKVTLREDVGYDIRQLTHNGSNRSPSLDDGFVVFISNTGEGDEISIAGLTGVAATPSRITDNGGEKRFPDNHASERVVWSGREDGTRDWEIWVYDKYRTPRFRALTDDDEGDHYPELAGSGDIAWIKGGTMFGAVFYWDESEHSALPISEDCCPTTEWSNSMMSADDGAVVWRANHRSGSGEYKTYLWDNGLTDLTNVLNAQMAVRYSLDSGSIAYVYASTYMIRYWDGTTIRDVDLGDYPSLDDGKVAFEVWDGNDYEIRYWDGATVYEITENNYNDTRPSLSGSMIAWEGRPDGPGGSYQIMYVDLTSGPAGQ